MGILDKKYWDIKLQTKKQIIKQYRLQQYTLLACFLFSICLIGVLMYQGSSYPTIEFHKGILKIDGEQSYSGVFIDKNDLYNDQIHISMNHTKILRSIYHEYGHYLFDNRMTANDRQIWLEQYYNCNIPVQGYKNTSWAEEQFADQWSGYCYYNLYQLGNVTQEHNWQFNFRFAYTNPKERWKMAQFFYYVYENYIPD